MFKEIFHVADLDSRHFYCRRQSDKSYHLMQVFATLNALFIN